MHTVTSPRRLLLVDEVAELARVSPDKVRRAVRAGNLDAIRIGPGARLLRFRPTDVDAWLGDPHEEDHDAA
jgi:excisionase family DNA binding protein